jgi:hypothetical protein
MNFVKVGGMVCLWAMILYGVALGDWSGAAADQYISNLSTSKKTYSPAMAASPSGDTLYVVWEQGSYPSTDPVEIYFSRSLDGGTTWSGTSADQKISPNDGCAAFTQYDARMIDIATDSQGRIFVVWIENYVLATFDSTREVMMIMSTNGGTSWIHSDTNYPISDTLSDEGANCAGIAIDNNDNIHVVWEQLEPATDETEIYYSSSSDNGATWTGRLADRHISYLNSLESARPHIDVDISNNIHVVWSERYGTGDSRILYGVSTDGGTTFSSETSDSVLSNTTPSLSYLGFPRITTGPSAGYVHVIYVTDDTAKYVGTTNGGASWNETILYVGSSGDMDCPDIAVTSTGVLVAILDEEYPGTSNKQVYSLYSLDNGITWTTTLAPVSNYSFASLDRSYTPYIMVTPDDFLHVAYTTNYPSTSNSYQEICYSWAAELTPPPGILDGTVTELDGTTPIEDVQIIIYDSLAAPVAYDTTSAGGNYVVILDAGTYSATYSKYSNHDTTITNIVLVNNSVTTVDVSLRPMAKGTVSGNVYEETGTNPLDTVRVKTSVYPNEPDYDTTDAAGYYELSLYPGTYSVLFDDRTGLFFDTTVTGVTVTEGGSIDLDVNMRWAIPSDDVSPSYIIEPPGYMDIDSTYAPAVTVRNYSYQDQTFDLNLIIEDENRTELYNQTIEDASIDSLATIQLVFGVDFDPVAAGDYTFTAIVINTGDEVPDNDTLVEVITAYQHQGRGGPDDFGYTYKDNTVPGGPVFNWIDIASPENNIHPNSAFFMDTVAMDFSFEFYGNVYDTIFVSSHGTVHIGIKGLHTSSNTCPIPSASTPSAPMAMVNWNQNEVQYDIGQGVYFKHFPDTPYVYSVVQWDVSNYGENDTMQFQVIFYGNGDLVYQYNKVSPYVSDGQGQSSTIGIEYDVPPILWGLGYICNDNNPANRLFEGLAIRWTKSAEPCYEYLPGDVNMYNGVWPPTPIVGADATYLINFFRGFTTSHACFMNNPNAPVLWPNGQPGEYFWASADVNGDCQVIGADVTKLINYLRGSGTLSFCVEYEPCWHNSGEVPVDPPSGWPNCVTPPPLMGKMIKEGVNIK